MKKNFIIAGLLVAGLYNAQQDGSVGINIEPKGATLHVTVADGANVADGQGVAVPNVDKARLNQMTGTIVTSAMVYVTDASATDGSRTSKVKEVGYHYFDGTEWVKLGGGSASATTKTFTARTGQTASSGYDWTDGGKGLVDFYEFSAYSSAITLPSPADHKDAILYIRNNTGGTRNFGGQTAADDGITKPKGVSSLVATAAMTIWSDGTHWHNISGRQ